MEREDEESLVERLASMIARAPEAFIAGHVVLPTPDYFPEPWKPTRAGLTTLALRLHMHLGLTLDAAIELDAEDESSTLLVQTAIRLESIDGNVARYRVSSLGRPEDAVFALLHEAARAADLQTRRSGHGPFRESAAPGSLRTPDDAPEAHRDASVLAVARGLGVLVAIGAHTYRQAGTAGPLLVTEWQHATYGGLAPLDASYLLALQLSVREEIDRAVIVGHLPANRALEIRKALTALAAEPVASMLELPPQNGWPAPATLPVRPIARVNTDVGDAPVGSAERRRKRAGKRGGVVFRVREPSPLPRILRSAFLAQVLGGVGYFAGRWAGDAWPTVLAIAGITAGVLSVFVRGKPAGTANSDSCSDRQCGKTIPLDLERCPGCGRHIVAVVYSQREATELEWAREEERAKRLE